MDRSKELKNCSTVKTLLMLLIVLYHSIIFWAPVGWFPETPVDACSVFSIFVFGLNSFHIYTFVLISGYIFSFQRLEQGKYEKYSILLQNKTRRLLIPYGVTAILWAIPFYVFFFKPSFDKVVSKFFFLESPSQLWFLIMLFGVFCFFGLILDFFVKHEAIGWIICLCAYGLGTIGKMFFANVFQIWSILQNMLFFFMGVMLRKKGITWLRKIPSLLYLILFLACFLTYYRTSGLSGRLYTIISLIAGFLSSTIGSLAAFVILQRIANHLNPDSKLLRILNRHSMTIYLLHQQLIYVVISAGNGVVHPYMLAVICFVFSLTVSLLIAEALQKLKKTH